MLQEAILRIIVLRSTVLQMLQLTVEHLLQIQIQMFRARPVHAALPEYQAVRAAVR
jgi:hypothetical protein